jgi:DNA-binding PadR family transcriptional regulator
LDYAVLSLVIESPSYGYGIWERFDSRFGVLIPTAAAPWAVYRALKRLVTARLVEAGGGRQRVYVATDAGRDALTEWWVDEIYDPAEQAEMLVRVAAARGNGDILRIIGEYERRCHDEIARAARHPDRSGGLVAEILHDERQFRVSAQLAWISRTRERLLRAAT